MCCLWRTCGASELTPRWHDKRGTLVATAVCHKKHENEIDASTIVIDTSIKERATSAAPPTAPAGRDGFIVFRAPGGMNARAVRSIMKQNRRELWAATKQQVEPEDDAALLLDLLATGTHDHVFNRSLLAGFELMRKM